MTSPLFRILLCAAIMLPPGCIADTHDDWDEHQTAATDTPPAKASPAMVPTGDSPAACNGAQPATTQHHHNSGQA